MSDKQIEMIIFFKYHFCINKKKLLPHFSERQKKLLELKKEKTKFEEGMWNVNTVFMGGLGRDPHIEGT
jgi:hypothetical protein